MNGDKTVSPGESVTVAGESVVVKVESERPRRRSNLGSLILLGLLAASVMMNLLLIASTAINDPSSNAVRQVHRDGSKGASDKLAVIQFTGTIMPPFTDRWIEQIRDAVKDDTVKGVLLEIDSPGGLVADSHQLYHELQKLRAEKPIYVAMKRMAASGGYYIAMGAGPDARVFAEPTTWTGSIGVILPRYNASELASKIGVKTEPFVTGPLKGSLSPFRDLRDDEVQVWEAIVDDSFQRFISVIADNRDNLDSDAVRALATGQVYTSNQALENGLIDQTGFVEDALTALADSLSLTEYEVVNYASPKGLLEVLMGSTQAPPSIMDQLMEASVPRAFYYCSWNPVLPVHQ
ncbi:MAG: signal peptide peptidase SppA [Planctomycetaceae bacterium]